jgi:hypothetical protein
MEGQLQAVHLRAHLAQRAIPRQTSCAGMTCSEATICPVMTTAVPIGGTSRLPAYALALYADRSDPVLDRSGTRGALWRGYCGDFRSPVTEISLGFP